MARRMSERAMREQDIAKLTAHLYAYATRHRVKVDTWPIPALVVDLHRVARSLHHQYENACNVEQTDRMKAIEAAREDDARRIVARLRYLTGADIALHFNGDPRGAPIKLALPPFRKSERRGPTNGWDDTWVVY